MSLPKNANKMYVFVYGTLKRKEPNCQWLLSEGDRKAKFVGNGKTKQLYPLVIASKYNIPFLLDKPGVGKNIHGEIYEINEDMLAHLDILEEYPKLYTRRIEDILPISDQNTQEPLPNLIQAVTYFLSDFKTDMLELPYLDNYSAYGSHNLPYVSRYLRDKNIDHRFQVKTNWQP